MQFSSIYIINIYIYIYNILPKFRELSLDSYFKLPKIATNPSSPILFPASNSSLFIFLPNFRFSKFDSEFMFETSPIVP